MQNNDRVVPYLPSRHLAVCKAIISCDVFFCTKGCSFCTQLPVSKYVVVQDPALSAAGEGLVPSVLAFCTEKSFSGPNVAAVFGIQDKQVSQFIASIQRACWLYVLATLPLPTVLGFSRLTFVCIFLCRAASLSSCTSVVTSDGRTTFAFPMLSGSIFIVRLPPPGSHGEPSAWYPAGVIVLHFSVACLYLLVCVLNVFWPLSSVHGRSELSVLIHFNLPIVYSFSSDLPERSELKESSVIKKLWNSFLPAAVRGSTEAEDAPVSLVTHLFGEDTVILALCRGLQLKVWTVDVSGCHWFYVCVWRGVMWID